MKNLVKFLVEKAKPSKSYIGDQDISITDTPHDRIRTPRGETTNWGIVSPLLFDDNWARTTGHSLASYKPEDPASVDKAVRFLKRSLDKYSIDEKCMLDKDLMKRALIDWGIRC